MEVKKSHFCLYRLSSDLNKAITKLVENNRGKCIQMTFKEKHVDLEFVEFCIKLQQLSFLYFAMPLKDILHLSLFMNSVKCNDIISSGFQVVNLHRLSLKTKYKDGKERILVEL